MYILDAASFSAVFGRQNILGNEFIQRFQAVRVYVDSIADFLLQEGFHPIDDGVDQRWYVNHVDLFQFHRVGFLFLTHNMNENARRFF